MAWTPTDLAWCTGFFEGEGNINIYKSTTWQKRLTPHYGLQIEVGNTNPIPLNRLQFIFGGSVHERRSASFRGNRARFFRWCLSSIRAAEFLKAISPYLTFKSEQAKLALAFQKTLNPGSRGRGIAVEAEIVAYRESLRLQLRELTRTGKNRRLDAKIVIPKCISKNQLQLEEV